jgi:hypothetical protein
MNWQLEHIVLHRIHLFKYALGLSASRINLSLFTKIKIEDDIYISRIKMQIS